MPAAQYYGVFCVIGFVQILPVHQAAPWVAGKGDIQRWYFKLHPPRGGAVLIALVGPTMHRVIGKG